MKYRLSEIKTGIDVPMEELPLIIAARTGLNPADIAEWEVRRLSIDSRKKPHIQYVYTADFVTDKKLNAENAACRVRGNATDKSRGSASGKTIHTKHRGKGKTIKGLSIIDEEAERVKPPVPGNQMLQFRPVVIGMGPCGLFAGLELAKLGYRPLILERGPAMENRITAVEAFRKNKVLDPDANMLFGEGGAGTFSDGKIGTGIKDSLIRQVLREFRDAGAGEDIMYLAKPHIGTDVLRTVIVNIRKKIERLGGEILFNTRMDSFITEDGRLKGIKVTERDPAAEGRVREMVIDCDALILAVGHSARDTFEMLAGVGIDMEQKPFSIGVRMEHPQAMIDAAQYGEENVGKLPPADYRIAYKASNGRGVYSFCMCPGGEVVVCTTREGELCVNGMSNRARSSGTANSGILCDVRTEDFGSDDVLAGVRFQEKYERLAFINGGNDFTPPRCRMEEFLEAGGKTRDGSTKTAAQSVIDSLPDFAAEAIWEAVPDFARKIKGYDDPDAVVTAVETRSSSPVRIVRGETGESSIHGIYPAGEGAGYAGGITSAACDGIRAAWRIVEKYVRSTDTLCDN